MANHDKRKDRKTGLSDTIATLEARVLEGAAGAYMGAVDSPRGWVSKYRAELIKLVRPIVYPDPDTIPVDRANRPMFDKWGSKLDIEER